MCQLIAKPEGKTIPEQDLKKCWDRNSDGAGFAYVDKDEDGQDSVLLWRGFFTFQEFLDAWKTVETKQALLHFRIATHGDKCQSNCHPFWVSGEAGGIVMGHNGVLHQFADSKRKDKDGKEMSDTNIFVTDYAEKMLGMAPGDILEYLPLFAATIEPLVGGNKLVFMTVKGFVLVNKYLGDVDNGIWYSNGIPSKWQYNHASRTRVSYYGFEGEVDYTTGWVPRPEDDPDTATESFPFVENWANRIYWVQGKRGTMEGRGVHENKWHPGTFVPDAEQPKEKPVPVGAAKPKKKANLDADIKTMDEVNRMTPKEFEEWLRLGDEEEAQIARIKQKDNSVAVVPVRPVVSPSQTNVVPLGVHNDSSWTKGSDPCCPTFDEWKRKRQEQRTLKAAEKIKISDGRREYMRDDSGRIIGTATKEDNQTKYHYFERPFSDMVTREIQREKQKEAKNIKHAKRLSRRWVNGQEVTKSEWE